MKINDTSVASKGKLDADEAAEERKNIRETLLKGDKEVKITQSGDAKPASEVKPGDGNTITAAEERKKIQICEAFDKEVKITQNGDSNQESEVKLYADSVAEELKKLRESLLNDDKIYVLYDKEAFDYREEFRERFFTSNLGCNDVSSKQKLCKEIKCSFEKYSNLKGNKICSRRVLFDGHIPRWYEANPRLLKNEIELMNMHYPGFTLRKDVYGDLCWIGVVNPIIVRSEAEYTLRLLYGYGESQIDIERVEIITTNINKSNMNYKLFKINPDIMHHFERLPVLCSTCAADCITRTIKWLNVYELFLAGYLSGSEFEFIAYSMRKSPHNNTQK